jgi:hypothetical protein
MNSYNENLHSTVVASLLELDQDQKKMKSQLNASIFTLYYAEGARITADERLQSANGKYAYQQKVVEQAVNNSNISANLLSSATQQKAYTAQSVTNTAVGASNTQIAANAILRLAADIGSVYAILSAADYGSEIYQQSREVNERMKETAYAAESASQLAMEVSTSIAEVSSSVIADKAKVTNDSITNLLQVTTTDFATITATVAAKNAELSAASNAEKLAEGTLENINVEYFATKSAYRLNNKSLNLNLSVDSKADDSYTVSFENYASPFTGLDNPVSIYSIILVKDSAKSVFSISNAEALLFYGKQHIEIKGPFDGTPISSKILITSLQDSDGDAMALGTKYVVFVLATLNDQYKKSLSNFDDYLSAPSATFTLTNRLQSPAATNIKVAVETRSGDTTPKQYLEFPVPDNPAEMEYRCILLPDSTDSTKGLLTADSLRSIEQEIINIEIVAAEFGPRINSIKSELTTLGVTNDSLEEQHQGLISSLKTVAGTADTNLSLNIDNLSVQITTSKNKVAGLQKELKSLEEKRSEAIKALAPPIGTKPGFFFNRKLAEQVSSANYTVANIDGQTGSILISEDTTDNFGNLLIKGNNYVPVILSASTAKEQDLAEYRNALSKFVDTASFLYSPQN